MVGLELAVDMKQLRLRIYGDSQLIVNQLLGEYDIKKPELILYYNYVRRLMGYLRDVTIEHLSREKNKQADALAKLTSNLCLHDQEAQIPICQT
jgi:ribonuclease HI